LTPSQSPLCSWHCSVSVSAGRCSARSSTASCPDHLDRSELPAGNALVEGATFIAILLGTIVGGLAAHGGGDPASFGFLMLIFSLACWGASLFIPPTGEAAPDLVIRRNVVASTASLISHLRDDKRIWWGAFVTSWFWLAGAVVATVMQPLVKDALGGTEEVITTCNAIFCDLDRDRLGPGGLARGGSDHPCCLR